MVNKTLETNEGTPLRVEQLDKSIADTIKKKHQIGKSYVIQNRFF